jgi:hypothetical protein
MSFRNGDKAREGRLRKKKLARRITNDALRKAAAPPAPAVKPASEPGAE